MWRVQGPVTAILYSQLATRLISLAIILPDTFTYYHSSPRLQLYPPNYHLYRYAAGGWSKHPYTIIAFFSKRMRFTHGISWWHFTLFPTRRYNSTIRWWKSTPHIFRDLPIITMIIWTSLPQIESIEESIDDFGSRFASDTPQWSSWPIPTHEESKHMEQEKSHTIEPDTYTNDWNWEPTFGEAATTRSRYCWTRQFMAEAPRNEETIYKST